MPRLGAWKLRVSNRDPNKKEKPVKVELYHLKDDPYEFYHIAERKRTELFERLYRFIVSYWAH